MKKKTIVTADSACDFNQDMAIKYNVDLVPLKVLLNDIEYKDNLKDVTPNMIYDSFYKTKQTPKTAAPTLTEYEIFFSQRSKEDAEIIHISFAGALSSAYNNAVIASRAFNNVLVVDSEALFAGYAMLVILACRLRDEGKSAQEIQKFVEEQRTKVRTSFIIPDLEFLRRGGRCSSLTALGANLLNIKPSVEMEKGLLNVAKKYRGKPLATFQQYFQDKLALAKEKADTDFVFIGHSGIDENDFDVLRKMVKDSQLFKNIIEMRAGCITSSHCGPGTVALIFKEK